MQACELHSSCVVLRPLHHSPPYIGGIHSLVCDLTPPPHVTEHSDHSDQSVHIPSTNGDHMHTMSDHQN